MYEYDSIYDEMQKKKEENNPKLLLGKDRKVSSWNTTFFDLGLVCLFGFGFDVILKVTSVKILGIAMSS